MQHGSLGKHVFLSYSSKPKANAEFANWLLSELRAVGFDVWFDEERIAGADHIEDVIEEGIRAADHGIFVVSERWLRRQYTNFEIRQFLLQHPDDTRHRWVAIVRDDIEDSDLPHEFKHRKKLRWKQDEADPEARLWEVYCALTGGEPGPKNVWAEKWKTLRTAPAPDPKSPEADKKAALDPADSTEAAESWSPFPERPVGGFSVGERIYLSVDTGGWFCVQGGRVAPIAEFRDASSVAVAEEGTAAVGLYDHQVALWVRDQVSLLNMDAPVLAVALTRSGLAAGDAAGGLTFVGLPGKRRNSVRCPASVVEIRVSRDGSEVIALCRDGSIGRIAASNSHIKPNCSWLQPRKDVQKPAGLFDAGEADRFGVFTRDRLATIQQDDEAWEVCPVRFSAGIRQVEPFGMSGCLGVLTDDGRILVVDSHHRTANGVIVGSRDKFVAGMGPDGRGELCVWTETGELYLISHERVVRRKDVSSVAGLVTGPAGVASVVQWSPDRGVRLVPLAGL